MSLPGRPGHHKLGISNGLRGFCLLLMGSSSAPCLHRWPVQAPLSPSPQILLSRTVRSAPTGCFLDPIRGPCHGSELWRVRPCGLVAVPSRTLFLLPGIPVVPSHTPRSWQTRLPPPCGLQPHLLKSGLLTGTRPLPTALGAPGVQGPGRISFFIFSAQNGRCLLTNGVSR